MDGAIRLYIDNPTKGGTDGQEVSESSQEFPLGVIVNTKTDNYVVVKAALRCDSGFRTVGSTEIIFEGDTSARWQIADDDNYVNEEIAGLADYGYSLVIDNIIGDTNHIIWLKISATDTEPAKVDTSVKVHVYGNTVPA